MYDRHGVTVLHGDCLDVLAELGDASVDVVITDPPYGLAEVTSAKLTTALTAWVNGDREHVPDGRGFMGKEWDAFVPPPAVWDECLRVLKPGGHLAVFAGSRTVDLMGLSIRLAGFEIRDTLQWLYGSGFPKSHDVSKALDKVAGAERGSDGYVPNFGNAVFGSGMGGGRKTHRSAPATDAAREWKGWGTALKPAAEPIILARKPLESTVARNVLAHGVGGLNIDGCRTGAEQRVNHAGGASSLQRVSRVEQGYRDHITESVGEASTVSGRWPTNAVFTHHPDCGPDEQPGPCVPGCHVADLDQQSGTLTSGKMMPTRPASSQRGTYGQDAAAGWTTMETYGDTGGASRFFPCFRWEAKAPPAERPRVDGVAHPTVKPVALMRWLVRLLTPPGGLVLDPFAGSGTTGQAARAEGHRALLIERDPSYLPLITARLDARQRTDRTPTPAQHDDGEPIDLFDLLDGNAS